MKVGDGLDAETVLGSLINHKAILKVQELIADATAKGAKILLGGDVTQSAGNFIILTIVTGATKEMAVSKKRILSSLSHHFSNLKMKKKLSFWQMTPYLDLLPIFTLMTLVEFIRSQKR